MATMFSQDEVRHEMEKLQPLVSCNHCVEQGERRHVLDHVAKKHEFPAPYRCRECKQNFAREEKAKSHVSSRHKKAKFGDLISENRTELLTYCRQHTTELSQNEGMAFCHDRLIRRKASADKMAARAAIRDEIARNPPTPATPTLPMDVTPMEPPITPLSVDTPMDHILMTSPAGTDATSERDVKHSAAPSTQDRLESLLLQVLDGQAAISTQLADMQSVQLDLGKRVQNLEERQSRQATRGQVEALDTQLENIRKAVASNSSIVSAMQGECRKLGSGVAEVKQRLEDRPDLSRRDNALPEVLRVKEAVRKVDDAVRKVDDRVGHLIKANTTTHNRTRSAVREIYNGAQHAFHSFQQAYDAFENRPGASSTARNYPERTENEERTRRNLEL